MLLLPYSSFYGVWGCMSACLHNEPLILSRFIVSAKTLLVLVVLVAHVILLVLYCAFYTYAFTLKFAVGAIRSGEGEKGGGLDVCTMRYALLYNIGFIQNLFFFLRIYHKELDIRIVFIPF